MNEKGIVIAQPLKLIMHKNEGGHPLMQQQTIITNELGGQGSLLMGYASMQLLQFNYSGVTYQEGHPNDPVEKEPSFSPCRGPHDDASKMRINYSASNALRPPCS